MNSSRQNTPLAGEQGACFDNYRVCYVRPLAAWTIASMVTQDAMLVHVQKSVCQRPEQNEDKHTVTDSSESKFQNAG